LRFTYSVFSMLGMFLFYALLVDLAVFSTKVSAYVLVCKHVISEGALILLAVTFLIVSFSSAVSVLRHDSDEFAGVPPSSSTFFQMILNTLKSNRYEDMRAEPVVLGLAFAFKVIAAALLLNMLIAQFMCAYENIYVDMLGFARLERMEIIGRTMAQVGERAFGRFVDSLGLEKKLEFTAGDLGLSGGIQVKEPSNLNLTTVDTILRYGGSTSPTTQWPEDDSRDEDDVDDRYDRVEALLKKALRKASAGDAGNAGDSVSQSISGTSLSDDSRSSDTEAAQGSSRR